MALFFFAKAQPKENRQSAKKTVMTKFSRIMIAFDLSEMDSQLLRFTRTIKDLIDIKKMYFLHIMPDLSLPKNVDLEFHKLFSSEYPVDEKIEDKIKYEVEEIFGKDNDLDYDIEVVEGEPYQKLIHWAGIKEVGLLIVGRKKESEGSGITARRVARHAASNILFVPEEARKAIHRILVPVDYSENSARAMQAALDMKKKAVEPIEVIAVHIIDLPPADYYMRPIEGTGFVKMLEDSAKSAFKKFLEKNSWPEDDIMPVYIHNSYNSTAAHLSEFADQENIDLIIMGAQGHSAFNSFLFGSVTEKLLTKCDNKPILIVR